MRLVLMVRQGFMAIILASSKYPALFTRPHGERLGDHSPSSVYALTCFGPAVFPDESPLFGYLWQPNCLVDLEWAYTSSLLYSSQNSFMKPIL